MVWGECFQEVWDKGAGFGWENIGVKGQKQVIKGESFV